MTNDAGKLRVTERVVLQKFEGDAADGKLIETVHIEDGRIVGRELHGTEQ